MQKTHAGEGEKAKAEEETFGRSTTLFPIVKDGKLGFIDRNGTVVVKPQYDRAAKESVLDWRIHGRLVPCAPDRRPFGLNEFFWGFHEGMGVIYRDGKSGYIRADGTIAFTPQFQFAERFHNGIARVGTDLMGLSDWHLEGGRWGYIDREANWIWQPTE